MSLTVLYYGAVLQTAVVCSCIFSEDGMHWYSHPDDFVDWLQIIGHSYRANMLGED